MADEMIDYTIYVSRAQRLMSEEELKHILTKSRQWNTDHGITGMLIYIEGVFTNTSTRELSSQMSGRFMQVLEGNKFEVDHIFNLIRTDPRHTDLRILQQSEVPSRNFDSWKMGFKLLTLEEYNADPGYFNLDETFLGAEEMHMINTPLQFLRSFYQRGMKETAMFS